MLSFFFITFIPIIFRKFIAIFNLGLSFLLSSSRFLNEETPLDLAAIKKISKNSSIALLFKFAGQLIDLKFFVLFIFISPKFSPL